MRPNALITRTFFGRGARLWFVTRLLVSAVLLMGAGIHPFRFSVTTSGAVVLLSVIISLVETYRHREPALLGNLVVGPRALVVMFALPAIAGELVRNIVGSSVS